MMDQQVIDWVGSNGGVLQEQIRVAQRLIQQLRTIGANPPPPTRTFLPRQLTEGGAFKALSKYTGNHSVYDD